MTSRDESIRKMLENYLEKVDEINTVINPEVASQNENWDKHAKICRDLSDLSDLSDQYRDLWLLLSLLLQKSYTYKSAPPFYKTSIHHTDGWTEIENPDRREYLTLQVKYLIWLEYIVRRYESSTEDSDNPIYYLRRSNHDRFLSTIAKKNDGTVSWKAEAFRGLFDPCFKNRKTFQETASELINSQTSSDNQEYIQFLQALTGDKEVLLELLQKSKRKDYQSKDPQAKEHDDMWASLFSEFVSFEDPSHVFTDPTDPSAIFTIEDDFLIAFQKYCFHINVLDNLSNEKYLNRRTIRALSSQPQSLSFAFMVSYLFQNQKMIKELRPAFFEQLKDHRLYSGFDKCTHDLRNDIACDVVSEVALSIDPSDQFISAFIPDRQKQLLDTISRKIITQSIGNLNDPNAQDYLLKALEWIKLFKSETDSLTSTSLYLVYHFVKTKQINLAQKAFTYITKCNEKEYEFWEHYLKYEQKKSTNPNKLDDIHKIGKSLILWSASLTKNNKFAIGYNFERNIRNSRTEIQNKSNDLLQYLFSLITQEYIDIQKVSLEKHE